MKSLANPGSWRTYVELQATSDCFNMTVFICSPNLSRILRWERKAVPRYHSAIKLPALHITPMLLFSASNNLNFFTVLSLSKCDTYDERHKAHTSSNHC